MYAVKSPGSTLGKLLTAAAGIEGRDGSPVARQLPPQYGRSFAEILLGKLGDLEYVTFQDNSHPVITSTGPAKALIGGALVNVKSSPTVTGCFVFSLTSKRPGSKKPGRKKRYWLAPMFAFVRYPAG